MPELLRASRAVEPWAEFLKGFRLAIEERIATQIREAVEAEREACAREAHEEAERFSALRRQAQRDNDPDAESNAAIRHSAVAFVERRIRARGKETQK